MSAGYIIKKINNHLEAGRNERLKQDGLTSAQLEFLVFLKERSDHLTSQKDISDHFGVKHTTTINILKKLEEKQLIYREVNKTNAKYRNVHLTPKGTGKVMEMRRKREAIDARIIDGMTEEEQAELLRLLERVYENVTKIN